MQAEQTAHDVAVAIGELGGAFMTDGDTYGRGGELGFSGIDFYVLGRGGALGDTTADVVSSAFFFWNPEQVRSQWESGRAVMTPTEAAQEWARLCCAYGERHLPDDAVDLVRLADLATEVVNAASPAGAALFAGWRSLPVPGVDSPKGRVQHQLNALRELRGGLHGGAVLAAGLEPREALAYRSGFMAPIFGWDPDSLPAPEAVEARWKVAEAGTDVAMGRVFSVLDESARAEFVELVTALHAAKTAAA